MKRASTQLSILLKMASLTCVLWFGMLGQLANAQTNITVQVDHPAAAIPPTLFGLFFEDINFGADGGPVS